MNDLQKVMNDKVTESFNEGKIEEIVTAKLDKAINECVESALSDVLKWNSDFKKGLEKKIEGTFLAGLEDLGFEQYNNAIVSLINTAISEKIDGDLAQDLKVKLDIIFGEKSEPVTLSQILDKIRVTSDDDYDEQQEYYEKEMTLIINNDISFTHIYIDKDENKSKYDCSIQIDLHQGKMYGFKANKYSYSSAGDEVSIEDLRNMNSKILNKDKKSIDYLLLQMMLKGESLFLDQGTDYYDYNLYHENGEY